MDKSIDWDSCKDATHFDPTRDLFLRLFDQGKPFQEVMRWIDGTWEMCSADYTGLNLFLIPRPSKEAVKADEPECDHDWIEVQGNPAIFGASICTKCHMLIASGEVAEPTQSPSDEWVDGLPNIGDRFESQEMLLDMDGEFDRYLDGWHPGTCIGKWGGKLILLFDPRDDIQFTPCFSIGHEIFRPVQEKSKEEKHREEVIEKAMVVLPEKELASVEWNEHATRIVKAISDAGMLQMPNKE